MGQIFFILFLCGILIAIFAWYRGRGEINKQYTWLSYLTLGISVIFIIMIFIIPISTLIGAPIAFILSVITLFKRNEKTPLL